MRLPRKGPLIDIEQSKQMIDTFLEAGFNYFDTAHGYMEMRNEATLKNALHLVIREKVIFLLTNYQKDSSRKKVR